MNSWQYPRLLVHTSRDDWRSLSQNPVATGSMTLVGFRYRFFRDWSVVTEFPEKRFQSFRDVWTESRRHHHESIELFRTENRQEIEILMSHGFAQLLGEDEFLYKCSLNETVAPELLEKRADRLAMYGPKIRNIVTIEREIENQKLTCFRDYGLGRLRYEGEFRYRFIFRRICCREISGKSYPILSRCINQKWRKSSRIDRLNNRKST